MIYLTLGITEEQDAYRKSRYMKLSKFLRDKLQEEMERDRNYTVDKKKSTPEAT
jgi:hypothetical protein